MKNSKVATEAPTFKECIDGVLDYEKLNVYWIQYLQELEEYYDILRKAERVDLDDIKLTKTQYNLILEFQKLIYSSGVEMPLKNLPDSFGVDFIFHVILSKLAQKQHETYIFPQSMWDRHALLTEVVNTIANIYV